MANSHAGRTAAACLRAWTRGDLEQARSFLHDDVTFRGPLGATDGADAYVDGIRPLSQMVDPVEPQLVIADGDDACLIYDLVVQGTTVPTVGCYHLRDGKIASIRAYFDPRPLLGG